MKYHVMVYCPLCPRYTQFPIEVEAKNIEEAKEKALYTEMKTPEGIKKVPRVAYCPEGHEFTMEEIFIISVLPAPVAIPPPPYEVMKETPKWLYGAWIVEDKPLPKGAIPIPPPYLVEERRIGHLTYFIFEMDVISPLYPDIKLHMRFARPAFTKFIEYARSLARRPDRGKSIEEAVYFLIKREPGLTIWHLIAMLGLSMTEAPLVEDALIRLEKQKKIRPCMLQPYVYDLEHFEKIKTIILKEKPLVEKYMPSKAVRVKGAYFYGHTLYCPTRPMTEEEILHEIKSIMTLDKYPTLSPEEEAKIREAMRKKYLDYWLMTR